MLSIEEKKKRDKTKLLKVLSKFATTKPTKPICDAFIVSYICLEKG